MSDPKEWFDFMRTYLGTASFGTLSGFILIGGYFQKWHWHQELAAALALAETERKRADFLQSILLERLSDSEKTVERLIANVTASRGGQ